MKTIEQFRRWLSDHIDSLEGGDEFNESLWKEAHALVDEAREYAYQLRLPDVVMLAKPGEPRLRLCEMIAALPSETVDESALIDLATAAELLGYKPAGLRKVVKAGQIRYVQNGKGPIKFRREWVEEFIKSNNPKGVERSPSQRRTPPPPISTVTGFDPKYFKN